MAEVDVEAEADSEMIGDTLEPYRQKKFSCARARRNPYDCKKAGPQCCWLNTGWNLEHNTNWHQGYCVYVPTDAKRNVTINMRQS